MSVRPTRREPLAAWAVAAVVGVAGLAVIGMGHLRLGGYVLAGAFAVAAVLRAVLPAGRVGALGIRPRALDVIMYAGLAVVVGVGAWAVNIPPPGA